MTISVVLGSFQNYDMTGSKAWYPFNFITRIASALFGHDSYADAKVPFIHYID